jgi:hypothetical protein
MDILEKIICKITKYYELDYYQIYPSEKRNRFDLRIFNTIGMINYENLVIMIPNKQEIVTYYSSSNFYLFFMPDKIFFKG